MSEQTTLDLADGRKLTVQQPGILQETRLVRALGESAANAVYFSAYAIPAAFVCAIDGDPVPFPNTVRELEGLIQRLGREGLDAVRRHLVDSSPAPTEGAEDDLKN